MKMTLKRLFAAGVVASVFSVPVAAETITYNVDPSHTFANFSYNHMGLSQQVSRFNNTSGTIALDLEGKTGEVNIEIDTTSVNTGFPAFNEHIQGEDFLDTAKFPTATFKSTNIVFEGDTPTAVEGDLTIKGVTKPVTLDITYFAAKPHPMLQKPALGANAQVEIKRSDFNADKFVPNVGDEVTLNISLEAVSQ